jgi:hypothetical protein
LQSKFSVSITPTGIIEAMNSMEVPGEMQNLIETILKFTKSKPGARKSN